MQRSLAHPWGAVVTSVTLIRSRCSYTHAYKDTQVCMFVCLIFWVYLTAGGLTLIRSRSSYNHTYQHAYLCEHAYLCVSVCLYLFFFCLFFWVYLTIGCLTLCFSSIQGAWFEQQHVFGPATRHFCWAFIASVSVRVLHGWVLRYCARGTVLIFYHYSTCLCLRVCFCVTVCTGRRTDTVERLAK